MRRVVAGAILVIMAVAIGWRMLESPRLSGTHHADREAEDAAKFAPLGTEDERSSRQELVQRDAPEDADGRLADPRQLSVVVAVRSDGTSELSPAEGAIVWLSHWVDSHVSVPGYATRLEAGSVLDESGTAEFQLDSRERATIVVEYYGQRERVQITPHNRPTDGVVRVILDAAAGVVGVVRLDGLPLTGAKILLMPDIDGPAIPVKWIEAETGDTGQFAIRSAPPGVWRFEVRSDAVSGWRSKAFQLHPGLENRVDLEISGLGGREVLVLGVDGEPVYRATVNLSGPDWELYGPSETDEFGIARFSVPDGLVVDASVRSRPPAGMAYPLFKGWDGHDQSRVTIQLTRCDQSIRGIVVFGGRRAMGGTVRATQQGLRPVAAPVSAADGSFVLEGLLPNTPTTLRYSAGGMESSKLFRVMPDADDYFVELKFGDSLVRVTARDRASGSKLANCPFVIIDSQGGRIPNTLGTSTDSNGAREVRGLEPGQYQIAVGPSVHGRVNAGSHGTVVRDFTIHGGGEELDLVVDLPSQGREIMLRVLDEQGQAVKAASVFVVLQGIPLATFDLFGSNDNGIVQIAGLPDSDVELVVVKPGMGSARKLVSSAQTDPIVEVRLAQGRVVQLRFPDSMVQLPQLFSFTENGRLSGLDFLSAGHGQSRRSGYSRVGATEFRLALSPGQYCVVWESGLHASERSKLLFTVESGAEPLVVNVSDSAER